MARVIAFHKPYGVLSQFTEHDGHAGLAGFGLPAGVYASGRLDRDSEGLLLLTDDGALQRRLTDPRFGHPRTYWAQVEGVPTAEVLRRLERGVALRDGMTRPCRARLLREEPALPPRDPPIRLRKSVPTAWLELVLTEGRNRQVRRMTAAVGLPTLRLARWAIGSLTLDGLAPGRWRPVSAAAVLGR
jgi:23S rRNA pseudouridine2457 synthase